MPYKEVKPQPEDARKVITFFSFTCPVCAAYHEPISRWGSSLPQHWLLEFVPVVVADRDSIISLRAYTAAKIADPMRLGDFVTAVYEEIHDRGMSPQNQQTWIDALRISKVRGFEAAWRKVDKSVIEKAARKMAAYGVNATPTMAIAGRYLITPDDTNGDRDLFFKLANAMVSKSML